MAANWIDRALASVAPGAARKRLLERRAFEKLARAYDGAAVGRRTDGWRSSSSSADGEIASGASRLRDRMRDLTRNNPHAAKAVAVLVNNIVGAGIRPRAATGTNALDNRINELWAAWAARSDADGLADFHGLTSLAMREMIEGGDVFLRRRIRRPEDKLPVPLQLQLLEADHLDDTKLGALADGGRIVRGIEYDAIGRRRAYWLFPDHPGDTSVPLSRSLTSARVPADGIAHLFERQRVQSRGVPWGAPAMRAMRDLDDWTNAELVRKKTEACLVGVVLGADEADQGVAPTVVDAEGKTIEQFEPGLIAYARGGKDIKFNQPASTAGVSEWLRAAAHHRRRIPRALRVAHRRSVSGQLFEPARRSRRIPPYGRCPAMAIGDPGLLRTGLADTLDVRETVPENNRMTVFATEFPVKSNVNRTAFISEVIAWLRGANYSNVLSSASSSDLDEEHAVLQSPSGEELRVRELRQNNEWVSVGFRYDNPDPEGRLWRTEGVLKRSAAVGEHDVVRLRTQCLAIKPGVKLEAPRKPYLIKALLKNGWGGNDLTMNVADQPIWLNDDMAGLKAARAITVGEASKWLPTLYISATGKGLWLLDKREIEKLAYDLGGIAHVVVEPDRTFSFRLRDECVGKNAYGGTVALAVPTQGVVRRYYLGWQIQDATQLAKTLREAASTWRGQMQTFGWDWTELQEQALRAQRIREKGRLSAADNEQLYQEEINNLQDRIRELEQQLNTRPTDAIGTDEGEFSTENLVKLIGPEVYSGEISDRLRFASKSTLIIAEKIGLDARSKTILQRIIERLPLSPALNELSQDIGRATKDPKRVASELTSLLARHGYREKSDNKHIRLEAADGFDGLANITVPKTPSDIRGLKNLRSQIETTLGLTNLTKK